MLRFNTEAYLAFFALAKERLDAQKDYITDLDLATGDGDHWDNMHRGLTALTDAKERLSPLPLAAFFKEVGMIFMSSVGGSSGVLYGGSYLAASKAIGEEEAMDLPTLYKLLEVMLEDICQRGRVERGWKTMVDALAPAVVTMKRMLDEGAPAEALLSAMAEAAEEGAAATKEMPAIRGRANYQANKGVGHLDPGAVTMALQIRALAEVAKGCLSEGEAPMDRRTRLQNALDLKPVDRVPGGFWHHFILGRDQFVGLEEPEKLETAYQGHLAFFEQVQPDMMKLMNEGFFGYPPVMENPLEGEADLLALRAIGAEHPWMQEQVKHVARLCDAFADEVMCFYNFFAPLQVMRIKFDFLDLDFDKYKGLATRYPEAFHAAGMEIAKDMKTLASLLMEHTRLDGFYYCVQNIQSELYDEAMHARYIKPTELPVLEHLNRLSENNILHICGYAKYTNHMHFYKDYPAKAYNWAIHTEKFSVAEGRKLFPNKCIIGGFDNNPGTLIDRGSEEELRAYTRKLLEENGTLGYIMGADCSVPNDMNDAQLAIIMDELRRS